MSKRRKVVWAIILLLFIWLGMWVVDDMRIYDEKRPIFCIETTEGHFVGLGYSFDTYKHPITGKLEYTSYFFGALRDSNVTN